MTTHHLADAVRESRVLIDTLNQADDSVVHIAFGINHAYARGMGITLFSLLKHHPATPFHIHIFSDALADDDIARLQQLGSDRAITITLHLFDDSWLTKLPSIGRYPKSIHYRFLIPGTVARYSDRVIYIDADTLVVGDYSPLFSLDMTNVTLAACNDTLRARSNQCPRLNITTGNYFNSGFLLINITRWLEKNITQTATQLLEQRGSEFGFPDQDALNIVLEHDVKILPDRYNFIYDIIANKVWHSFKVPEDTVMIHYTGKCKPWHLWAGGDLSCIYYTYHQQSPWADVSLETPKHYKEMKRYARIKMHDNDYSSALKWMCKYVANKMIN